MHVGAYVCSYVCYVHVCIMCILCVYYVHVCACVHISSWSVVFPVPHPRQGVPVTSS